MPPQTQMTVFVRPDSERQQGGDGVGTLEKSGFSQGRGSAAPACVFWAITNRKWARPRRNAGDGNQ